MPPLCRLRSSHPDQEWGPIPTPGLDGNWWAVSRSLASLSTEVFQAILTELTINTQPTTKEADSFQSFVHKSQDCITVERLSQVWIHQQWALGLGSWGSHLRQDNLPASWRNEEHRSQPTQRRVIPTSSRVGSCLERAGSKPPTGGVVSSLGDWIPWDLDP